MKNIIKLLINKMKHDNKNLEIEKLIQKYIKLIQSLEKNNTFLGLDIKYRTKFIISKNIYLTRTTNIIFLLNSIKSEIIFKEKSKLKEILVKEKEDWINSTDCFLIDILGDLEDSITESIWTNNLRKTSKESNCCIFELLITIKNQSNSIKELLNIK